MPENTYTYTHAVSHARAPGKEGGAGGIPSALLFFLPCTFTLTDTHTPARTHCHLL